MAKLLVLVLAVLVGGCATRGAIDIDCPQFDVDRTTYDRAFRQPLDLSPIEREIRGLPAPRGSQGATEDEQRAALTRQVALVSQSLAALTAGSASAPTSPDVSVLLLSGGGQWGAYGAGFMDQLQRMGRFPKPTIVIGVSTGGLQSLFVGAGLGKRSPWGISYGDAMRREYSPTREDQVVNRNSKYRAPITGSMAGLEPLRRKIENALCPNLTASTRRSEHCMLDDLRESTVQMLIGFIEADSGGFYYVDVGRIAKSDLTPYQKQQCITGAALASAAMPAFFQQVRINNKTYYDGGVRQSVFTALAHGAARKEAEARTRRLKQVAGLTPEEAAAADKRVKLYVLRNGPTAVVENDDANKVRNVIDTALRAEAIVVNQLEVGSVAALRIEYPEHEIFFRSADGWGTFNHYDPVFRTRTCAQRKDQGVMFDPDFMQCIMAYGTYVASEDSPWVPLPPPTPERLARATRTD